MRAGVILFQPAQMLGQAAYAELARMTAGHDMKGVRRVALRAGLVAMAVGPGREMAKLGMQGGLTEGWPASLAILPPEPQQARRRYLKGKGPESGPFRNFGPVARSHVRVVRAAAALRHRPHDVLLGVLDVAGFAMHAVLRVDLEARIVA